MSILNITVRKILYRGVPNPTSTSPVVSICSSPISKPPSHFAQRLVVSRLCYIPLTVSPIRNRPCLTRCVSSLSGMEAAPGTTLYPLHRTKTIHLVRHAQGIHNVAGEKDQNEYLSEEYFDARLTPLGWDQVHNLRKHVHESGINKGIELVIVSPLLRTLQTAVGVFGGEGYVDGVDVPPLMVENAGGSDHPAISSFNSPPFVAVELCREHLIENDDDILWKADIRETDEEIAARGLKFLNWLWTRKEKEIAVVSHSGFLYHTLSAFGNDCHPTIKKEICTHLLGSDPAPSNYPGKIPAGLDLPSDVAKKMQPEKDVRHAQGIHNIAGEKDHNALSSPEYFDAQLSPHGWEQVSNLNKQVQESGLLKKIDLVITSPLSRAMQTALAVFGSEDQSKEEEAEAEEESRKTSETSSVKCPPIIAVELCRERLVCSQ
ncbi:hypothetical protein Tsubulata_047040 [Turnera subulata]|uniref:Phosphoglycerate mutase-like protein n=1 Tax=Turnera subulata TaxID=218843 RepID=A0A9Q0FUE1_9ROSI|nr:hypothetical protein Tsubulata_047040 [Turnera subulata]